MFAFIGHGMIKQILILIFLILFSVDAHAMKTLHPGGSTTNVDDTATEDVCINGMNCGPSATETDMSQIVPIETVFEDLNFCVDTAPGSGKSYTMTFRDDGADTSITCAISGGSDKCCNDGVNTATVAQASDIAIKIIPSGTPATSNPSWSIVTGDDANESIFLGINVDSGNTSTSARRTPYIGNSNQWRTGSTQGPGKTAVAGVVKNFFVELTIAPGASDTWNYELRVNNSGSDGVACSISGASDLLCNDTISTAAVVAADALMIHRTGSGTPAGTVLKWGFEFEPTTDGDFTWGSSSGGDNASTSTAEYFMMTGRQTWSGSSSRETLGNDGYIASDLYFEIGQAPGDGKSYTMLFMVANSSAGAISCTISGISATTCSDTASTDDLEDQKEIEYRITPSGTPNSMNFISFSGLKVREITVVTRRIYATST